jgi:hypothetical protein
MIAGAQEKYLVSMDSGGNLNIDEQQAELMGLIDTTFNWKLVRERDGLTKQSRSVIWLEFNDDDTFKEKYDEIAINRSLIMSPLNHYFTWQTTVVTEIVGQREDYIKFKTKNSNYELFKIK